jgi:hypothetical protein
MKTSMRKMTSSERVTARAVQAALKRVELVNKAKQALDVLEESVRASQCSIGFALAAAFLVGSEFQRDTQQTEGYKP